MRSTGVQVSGFSFLLRRLELALLTGDPRMAQEPPRAQRRALVVGVLLTLLGCGGAAMLAFIRPEPALGDARLVADELGTLHVRVDDRFHPVTNLASARLILGEALNPEKTTAAQLRQYSSGPLVGFLAAPSLIPAAAETTLLACESGAVVAAVAATKQDTALVAERNGETWLLTAGKRFHVPAGAARAWGIQPQVVASPWLRRIPQGADVELPDGSTGLEAPFDTAGLVFHASGRTFMTAAGGVAEVRGARRVLAEGLTSSPVSAVTLAQVLELPSADVWGDVPETEESTWMGAVPEDETICTDGRDVYTEVAVVQGGAGRNERLTGSALASLWDGPSIAPLVGAGGSRAVMTETGFAVIDDAGTRFGVADEATLGMLGFQDPAEVAWSVIADLPDGGMLSAGRARKTVVTMTAAETTATSTAASR